MATNIPRREHNSTEEKSLHFRVCKNLTSKEDSLSLNEILSNKVILTPYSTFFRIWEIYLHIFRP